MATLERGNVGDPISDIPTMSIKYKDVFSLKNLYVMMHELLQEEGWFGWEGEEAGMSAHSDMETLYSENVYQKGIHHGGKEIWIWWRLQKNWEGRGSAYFKNVLDIDWHVVGAQDVEIVHQGKKMKVQKGELEIFFKTKLISDFGHGWQKHKFLKHFKPFYENRIMHPHIQKREKELWRDVYRVHSKVKAFLTLRTWMPTTEHFHSPRYGWEGQF